MTRTKERNQQLLSKIAILCFSMIIMLLMIIHFSIAALAAGQGKVIAATAKIRQSADPNC